MKLSKLSSAACLLAFCGISSAYTISGTVSDSQGKALKGVTASLLKEGKAATTDDQGKFSIHEDEMVGILPSYHNAAGYISINNGILSYQSGSSPVQVKIFNSLGSQVSKMTLQGSGMLNLAKDIKARGTYFAHVSMGSARQAVKFTTDGNYSNFSSVQKANALLKEVQQGEAIRFVLDGYDTLTVPLGTLDTTLDVKLTKTAPQFKFGYAIGNDPTPSKGCGSASKLQKVKSVENGDQFQIRVGSDTRDYFITLPKNYDNKKPHKVCTATAAAERTSCTTIRTMTIRPRTTASRYSTRTATTSLSLSTRLAACGPRARATTTSSPRLSPP